MDKVLCLSVRIWKALFLFLQILNLCFFIGAMASDYWFRQKWDFQVDDRTYKGKLLVNKKDLGFCDDGDSFNYCYHECRDWCDDNFNGSSDCKDFCDRYKYWHHGGVAYLVCGIIASVFTALSIITIFLSFFNSESLKKVFNLFTSAIFLSLSFVFHILGFGIYAGIVKLKYHDCSHDFDYSGHKSICGEDGARFAVFIIVWLFVLVPVYTIIARKATVAERNENPRLMG